MSNPLNWLLLILVIVSWILAFRYKPDPIKVEAQYINGKLVRLKTEKGELKPVWLWAFLNRIPLKN